MGDVPHILERGIHITDSVEDITRDFLGETLLICFDFPLNFRGTFSLLPITQYNKWNHWMGISLKSLFLNPLKTPRERDTRRERLYWRRAEKKRPVCMEPLTQLW